ncbi:MAG: regulator [Methylobacter sp.]|nr:regulator [Methylobacter sp.]
MTRYLFDDCNIKWQKLEGFENLVYSILNIDENNKIIDVIFKFAANKQIILHRHLALNNMLVIQGEHRLYEPNGRLKEARPVGSCTSSQPSDEPHREGGGDVDAVVFFSIRGNDGVLHEILDDDLNVIAALSMQNFIGLYQAQQECEKIRVWRKNETFEIKWAMVKPDLDVTWYWPDYELFSKCRRSYRNFKL